MMTPVSVEEELRLGALFRDILKFQEGRIIMGSERFMANNLLFFSNKGEEHNKIINEGGGGCVALDVQGIVSSDIEEVYSYEVYLKAWEAVTDNNGDGDKYREVDVDKPFVLKLRNHNALFQGNKNIMMIAVSSGMVTLTFDGTDEQKISEAVRKIGLVRNTMEKYVSAKNRIFDISTNKGIVTDPLTP